MDRWEKLFIRMSKADRSLNEPAFYEAIKVERQEAREEVLEGWAWADLFLSLGKEISDEAMPNYNDGDNEVYTIVDLTMNGTKYERRKKELKIADAFSKLESKHLKDRKKGG